MSRLLEAAEEAYEHFYNNASYDPSDRGVLDRLKDALDEAEKDARVNQAIALAAPPIVPILSPRELATVLAALRQRESLLRQLLQNSEPCTTTIPEIERLWLIASDNGELQPLEATEIDALCERLNCGPLDVKGPPVPEVLVEVRGGCVEISSRGEVVVELLDYDNTPEAESQFDWAK